MKIMFASVLAQEWIVIKWRVSMKKDDQLYQHSSHPMYCSLPKHSGPTDRPPMDPANFDASRDLTLRDARFPARVGSSYVDAIFVQIQFSFSSFAGYEQWL